MSKSFYGKVKETSLRTDWVSSCEYEVGRASLLFVFSYAEAISPCWPDTALANTIHNENQCHQVTKQLLCLLKCTSLQK